jgi:hypothetical protein
VQQSERKKKGRREKKKSEQGEGEKNELALLGGSRSETATVVALATRIDVPTFPNNCTRHHHTHIHNAFVTQHAQTGGGKAVGPRRAIKTAKPES